jgi:dTDP-4-amino-4,6-dideoxygalactose transaminase
MIPVTKPFLPPEEEFQALMEEVWQRNWLTNNGPLVNELELNLKDYLGLKHLLFVSNGTVALQLSIKALGLSGQVITTPFSYVATTSSLVWEGCEPVFVDIHPETFNINPALIENAITPNTSAIMATHCFGNPCDVEAIREIAERHQLKVVYDAAHCFGTTYQGRSILEWGDISTLSFHATKIFHTVEGGAVATSSPELLKRMAYMRNFGHDGPGAFNGVGINGKNSEFHAAMGICNLRQMNEVLRVRREQCELYDRLLHKLDVQQPKVQNGVSFNHAYYPIVLESEKLLLKVVAELERAKVQPRRYFYPSLNELEYVDGKGSCPVSEDISRRVLCLPVYHTLTEAEQRLIARIILRAKNY